MKRNILTLFAGNTPLRRVANIWQQNFIAAFINDLQGIGCRVDIPPDRGGMGARIIVDGSSDISPPGTMPWEASSCDAPFPFELYRDGDALKMRAGTLYRIEDGVTDARPLEDTGGQPDESATVLAEIPASAAKKIWVEKSSENITLESGNAFPAGRGDEIGVTWWPVGIVSTDADADITELDQYLLGHIYQAISGDALTALDDISIDKNSSEEVQIKDWETADRADSVAETALFPFQDTDGTLKYAQPGDIPVAPPVLDELSLDWSQGLKAQWHYWDQWTTSEATTPPYGWRPHLSSIFGIKTWGTGGGRYDDTLYYMRIGDLLAMVDPDPVDERSIDRATISGEEKIEIKGWNALTDAPPTYEPDDDDAIPIKKWDGSAYENVIGFATLAKLRLKLAEFIADAAYTTQTISDPPTQTEVQNINDGLVSAVGKINALLAALEAAGIMPEPEEE